MQMGVGLINQHYVWVYKIEESEKLQHLQESATCRYEIQICVCLCVVRRYELVTFCVENNPR